MPSSAQVSAPLMRRGSRAPGLLVIVLALLTLAWLLFTQLEGNSHMIFGVSIAAAVIVVLMFSRPSAFRRLVRNVIVCAVFSVVVVLAVYLICCQRVASVAFMPDGARVCVVGRVGDIRIADGGDGRTAIFTLTDWNGSVRCVSKTGPPPAGGWALVAGHKRTYKGETLIITDFRLANFLQGVSAMTNQIITREFIVWRPSEGDAATGVAIETEMVATLATDWKRADGDSPGPKPVDDAPYYTVRRYQSLFTDGSAALVCLTGTKTQIDEAVERLRARDLEVAGGDEPMRQHERGD